MKPVTIRVGYHRPLAPLVIVPSPASPAEREELEAPMRRRGGVSTGRRWRRLRAIEEAALDLPHPPEALRRALMGDVAA